MEFIEVNQFAAQWEDADNNRIVEYTVTYQVENSTVEIKNLTPTKVSFLCPTESKLTRTIGVHTLKGQTMIASQIQSAGAIENVILQIAEKRGLLATL